MRRLANIAPPKGATFSFWERDLVELATDRLLEADHTLDYLIVDEIQGLAKPKYLDVLDLLVKGGLAGGRCLLFGDFERQALYELEDGREAIRARMPALAVHALTANCRNLPRIGTAAELLAGLSPGYKRFRRQDDGTSHSTCGTRRQPSAASCSPTRSANWQHKAMNSTRSSC
jgi:hypothetical protein